MGNLFLSGANLILRDNWGSKFWYIFGKTAFDPPAKICNGTTHTHTLKCFQKIHPNLGPQSSLRGQRCVRALNQWLATVKSVTEKIKRRCVDSQQKSVKSCHSHPTPRIALFVRWFVCWWQNFSRIIDICTIHTFMLQEQGPGPYTYASGSRIEHRYMHHTYVYQDQGSWTCAWILVVVLFCGIIAG